MPDDLLTAPQRNRLVERLARYDHPARAQDSAGPGIVGGGALALGAGLLGLLPQSLEAIFIAWIVAGILVGVGHSVYKNQEHQASVQRLSMEDDRALLHRAKRRDLSLAWLEMEGVDVDRLLEHG